MRYLILILFISFNTYAIEWSYKYSGYSDRSKLNLNSNNKAINFNNHGTWEDNLGNYGTAKCQGMFTVIDNKNDMNFYCEYVDQDNQKIIGKGIRKSDTNAGIGNMIIIDGDEKWKKIIGSECTYAIKYKDQAFFTAGKCKKIRKN